MSYVLRGVKRTRAPHPDRRLPITTQILYNTWTGSNQLTYESRLLWAACCLGFFGFVRVGEFTARNLSAPPNPSIIGIQDISRAPGDPPQYLCIHLRVSITDPFGRGVHIYLGRTNAIICPVAAILSFLPSHLAGPLLQFADGTTLTRTFLVTAVKRALATAGIDPSRYSDTISASGQLHRPPWLACLTTRSRCWVDGNPQPTRCRFALLHTS